MSLNPVKMVYDFNRKAGLLDAGYSDERECAFPIEEALEGFNMYPISEMFDCSDTPKYVSRAIISKVDTDPDGISDVDRLDKHLDIIVFSFGSIFKLGLTPQQALAALEVVMHANMQKLSVGTDSHGKQQKPTDFVGPEAKLQEILDKRTL